MNRRVFDWARERANACTRVCKNWVTRVEAKLRQDGVTVDAGADICRTVSTQTGHSVCEDSTFAKWSNEVNRVRARRGQGLNKLRTYISFF